MKKINFEQACQKFISNKNYEIQLCKNGYVGWTIKSKFYDKIEKDYFWAIPRDVYRYNRKHPKRSKNFKVSFKKAKQKFIDQGREDLILCKNAYKSWGTKSKFYDKVVKDYFWSLPSDVYRHKIVHPNRRNDKFKKACFKKFKTNNPLKSKDIKEKIKKTNFEKYGFHFAAQNENTKEKTKKTNLKKYGKEFYLQTKEKQEKSKQTSLRKYGVDYPAKSNEIKRKTRETCLKKYGTDCFLNTILKKKQIIETKELVCVWLRNQQEPKPHKDNLNKIIGKKTSVSLIFLENYLESYRNNKTSLEVLSEKLFGIEHFNKKPKNIIKNYRPDFKLSNAIYMNVDGLYWHSELQKDKNHHFDVRQHFEQNNLKLIQFREDEIRDKPDICKSIANNISNKTPNKIYARKCVIKNVLYKEGVLFLEKNHLMGSIKAKHIGLFYNDKIVSLMSYKEKKNVCKIERFCSLVDHNIIGGFSKLLNFLKQNCLKPTTTEIHNWVDLRYGTGKHLLNKGFMSKKDTLGWKWSNGFETFNRLKCKANMDERKLTEKQHADELGWFKIYDAGQRLYVLNLNT